MSEKPSASAAGSGAISPPIFLTVPANRLLQRLIADVDTIVVPSEPGSLFSKTISSRSTVPGSMSGSRTTRAIPRSR